ncbi:MAG: hypothetical protein F6K58_22290 [Symploca sp. SIO2E9]|nr:hypothetical protein [Symploca sp. SIO2E9]
MGKLSNQTRRRGDAETRRRGDAETQRRGEFKSHTKFRSPGGWGDNFDQPFTIEAN